MEDACSTSLVLIPKSVNTANLVNFDDFKESFALLSLENEILEQGLIC